MHLYYFNRKTHNVVGKDQGAIRQRKKTGVIIIIIIIIIIIVEIFAICYKCKMAFLI